MSPRSAGDDHDNPFASPEFEPDGTTPRGGMGAVESVKTKVRVPAICLIIVGSLGLLMSIVNVVIATGQPIKVDPNAPEFMQGLQRGQVGPVAMAIQSVFAVVNGVIIIGAVQMLRFQSRIFAIVVSAIAIVNLGTCCCVVGAPIGIWSLIVLSSNDVVKAFEIVMQRRPT